MSGQKSTSSSVPRSTVTNARQQSSNTQSRSRRTQSAIIEANRNMQNAINRIERDNRRREERLGEVISGLSGSLRTAEERRLRDMVKQNRRFETKLNERSQKIQAQILNEKKQRKAELARTKATLEQQMNQAVGAEREARKRDVQRLTAQMDDLDRSLRREMQSIDNNLRKMIKNEAEQRRLEIKNLHQWTANNLEQQRKEYLDIAEQQRQEIETNRSAIRGIYERIESNIQAAESYINGLQKLVDEGYNARAKDYQKYTPGEINKIIRQVDRAGEELKNGGEQVAKSAAIAAYEAWLDMNEKMEAKKREFEFWHQETMKEVLALFEVIKQNRAEGHHMHGEKIVEVDGKEQEVYVNARIELDYWSNGEFAELEKAVASELERLENPYEISIDEIKTIREKVDDLKQQEDELIINAEERVIASQMRAELGDIAVEALEDEGFYLVRTGYDKKDQRRGYIVNLQNRGGADVVVSFFPGEANNENILDIQIRNEVNYSEEATKTIVEHIATILKANGIDVGEMACEETHLEAFYDFDKIFSKNGGLPEKEIKRKGGHV